MRDRDDRRDSRDDDDERREPRPKKRSMLWIILLVVGLVVLIPVVVVAVSVALFATTRTLEDAKVNQVSVQLLKIDQACKVYYTTNGGKWPTSLDELIIPSKDGPALLEGGPSALINPWGLKYQFTFEQDSVGAERLVVFTYDGNGNRHQWPRK